MKTEKTESVNANVQPLKGHVNPLSKEQLNELAKRQKHRENLVNSYGIINAICEDNGITIPSSFKDGFVEIWETYTNSNPLNF